MFELVVFIFFHRKRYALVSIHDIHDLHLTILTKIKLIN